MRFLIISFIVFINVTKLKSQIVIVDDKNNPIPYVDIVFSNNRSFLWQTDLNGLIPSSVLNTIDKADSLLIHHISFEAKKIVKQDLINADTIFLIPRSYALEEVKISAKSPKFQRITACFRNLQIQNAKPVFYTDGEVNYLTKNRDNLKYELDLIKYRAFEHEKVNQFFNDYKTGIPMSNAYIPIPKEKYLPYQFIKKHNLQLNEKGNTAISILTEDSIVIGELNKRGDIIEYKINNIFDIKNRKALNTEVNVTDFHIYMIFRKSSPSEKIELIDDFNQLLYLKIIYKHSLKHDKEKIKRNIETIEEIFVENITFLNEIEDEYTNSRGMPRESKFTTEFWKECDCELYYPPNEDIFDSMIMR